MDEDVKVFSENCNNFSDIVNDHDLPISALLLILFAELLRYPDQFASRMFYFVPFLQINFSTDSFLILRNILQVASSTSFL